ncbi:O-fucosyltransferase 38-like protein, partial [Drosera capensis]
NVHTDKYNQKDKLEQGFTNLENQICRETLATPAAKSIPIIVVAILPSDPYSPNQNSAHRGLDRSQECALQQIFKTPDDGPWDATFSNGLNQCINPTMKYKGVHESRHYLTVRTNGGLNQMRTGIADMVAVAHMMNATLMIPQLKDSSLVDDVTFVKELPDELENAPRARKHFSSWSGLSYYEEMTQLWKEYKVIHVAKSDSRVANNDLHLDIQRLRCRALYHALRFSLPIENLGKITRGRYIALHLRYEKDMLAFTGCTYGLFSTESNELKALRQTTNHWKIKKLNSTEQRNAGLCPLTPKEVGIFLSALEYPPSTLIYVAAGEIYGGRSRLKDLKSRFPNLVFKEESVAFEEELRAFSSHASQTAALDYIISVESDVFMSSYSGNMARAVEGHRRFLGHRKTITPDRKGLVKVFDKLESGQLQERSSLSAIVEKMHKNRRGAPRERMGPPPGIKGRARFRYEEAFYVNPYPECICRWKS